jgi:alpha-tubulin suppressor-like RCC1 family protein
MGVNKTGNFRSFGNDSHSEFLITSTFDTDAPANVNIDLSKNNYRINYWDSHIVNDRTYYKFAPFSFASNKFVTAWSFLPCYTESSLNLDDENFSVDIWFAKGNKSLITSASGDYFLFSGMADYGASIRAITGFTLGIYHQSSTNFELSFYCGFPSAGGIYEAAYSLGAYSLFTANVFHHVCGVKWNRYMLLLYDGVVVAATDTSSTKGFRFTNHRLDFFAQSTTSQEYYLDELRYSKNIRRFWGDSGGPTTTGKDCAIPNRPYASQGKLFKNTIIGVGDSHTFAKDVRGFTWAWGSDGSGALGIYTYTGNQSTPYSVLRNRTFCMIDGGSDVSGAIEYTGQIWTWGANSAGQLGINTSGGLTYEISPVSILGGPKTFCKISLGSGHVLAINNRGLMWAWGYNNSGQLGINSTTDRSTPVSVLGNLKTFCVIAAGVDHSLAIDRLGKAWSWGSNSFGPLGIGAVSAQSRSVPVSVWDNNRTFCSISAGAGYSTALTNRGLIWSWGYNTLYQLGNNDTTAQYTPVSIKGNQLKTFCKISSGFQHVLAIDRRGLIWGWGQSDYGSLGIGAAASARTPTSILGNKKTFCQISAGQYFSIALDCHGRVWGWGYNQNGQLGTNNTTSVRTPVMMIF